MTATQPHVFDFECPACGYDLRGQTTWGAPCPECGVRIKRPPLPRTTRRMVMIMLGSWGMVLGTLGALEWWIGWTALPNVIPGHVPDGMRTAVLIVLGAMAVGNVLQVVFVRTVTLGSWLGSLGLWAIFAATIIVPMVILAGTFASV